MDEEFVNPDAEVHVRQQSVSSVLLSQNAATGGWLPQDFRCAGLSPSGLALCLLLYGGCTEK
jgi:hypothetical protein